MSDEVDEMSAASRGSHGDPLSVCCRHLANSQAIIERKNAEIERLRLTDDEFKAVIDAIGCCEDITYGGAANQEAADTLRALLKRIK